MKLRKFGRAAVVLLALSGAMAAPAGAGEVMTHPEDTRCPEGETRDQFVRFFNGWLALQNDGTPLRVNTGVQEILREFDWRDIRHGAPPGEGNPLNWGVRRSPHPSLDVIHGRLVRLAERLNRCRLNPESAGYSTPLDWGGNNSSGDAFVEGAGVAVAAGVITWLLWPDAPIEPFAAGANDGRGYAFGIRARITARQSLTLTQEHEAERVNIRWELRW